MVAVDINFPHTRGILTFFNFDFNYVAKGFRIDFIIIRRNFTKNCAFGFKDFHGNTFVVVKAVQLLHFKPNNSFFSFAFQMYLPVLSMYAPPYRIVFSPKGSGSTQATPF